MRKSVCAAMFFAAVLSATTLTWFSSPVSAQDFFDNPRLVTDGYAQGAVFAPVTQPPAASGYGYAPAAPYPGAAESGLVARAESTGDIVSGTAYTAVPMAGQANVLPSLVPFDGALGAGEAAVAGVVDFGAAGAASGLSVSAGDTVDAPAAPAEPAGFPAIDPNNYNPNAAATHAQPSVVSFVVPVQIPAYAVNPNQQYYQQQQQQQYAAQQRQYAEQLRLQQEQQYAEQARRQQEAYALRLQQEQAYAAQIQQQQLLLQQQQQQALMQQQMQQAQQMQQMQQLQQAQQQYPAQYPNVAQFPGDRPVPPQPPQQVPSYAAPAADYPVPPYAVIPPAQPVDPGFVGMAVQPGSATQPLQASDYITTLSHPSSGGDKPVLALITPAEVKQALSRGVQLIMLDVRGELVRDVEGRIPGDVSVPYEPADTFAARVRQVIPNANYPVIVYCRDGIWSSKAGEVMARMGYRTYLMGAYRLWLWN